MEKENKCGVFFPPHSPTTPPKVVCKGTCQPAEAVCHAPCLLTLSPPASPLRGNSRPPTPQNKVRRDRARAFPCSSPVTVPAFSLAVLRQGRRRPFPLPHGPASPLLFFARRFSPPTSPATRPRKGKGPRQSLRGLSCPLL